MSGDSDCRRAIQVVGFYWMVFDCWEPIAATYVMGIIIIVLK